MHKLALYLIVLILIDSASAIVINEIMYNPDGTDTDREWIELYNQENSSINIQNWKFYEAGTNHGLTLIDGFWIIQPNNYAVIVDNPTVFLIDYPDFNSTLIDSSFSLKNTGEYLAIKDNNLNIIDEVNYSDSWGGTDISIERISSERNSNDLENWGNSLINKGTPGQQNSLFGTCDWSIEIIIDEEIWELENNTAIIKWKIKVEENIDEGNINLTYWIEDPTGEIIKSEVNKTSDISQTFGYYQKTFHQSGGYIIKANITDTSCDDYNPPNNYANTAIIVAGGDQSSSSYQSSMKILEAPSDAEFGDIVKIKINVYRGDTAKYAVYAYIENDDGKEVSEKSTMHFKNKFTNYTLTIPIQLKPNCNDKYNDGKHEIIIEGLDLNDKTSIEIEGIKSSLCEESSSSSTKTTSSKGFSYQLIEKPKNIEVGEEFEIRVNLENGDIESHEVDIWSYVYRGSKSYTGHRQDNLKTIILPAKISKIVTLKNLIQEAEPGDYKLKIKMQRDDYRTEKEITETIEVIESKTEIMQEKNQEQEIKNQFIPNQFIPNQNPVVIYESSSYKAKKLVPYLIIGLLTFFSIVLIWRR